MERIAVVCGPVSVGLTQVCSMCLPVLMHGESAYSRIHMCWHVCL
jgi:hypothetical protein